MKCSLALRWEQPSIVDCLAATPLLRNKSMNTTEFIRTLLVFTHLLVCVFALARVYQADVAVFFGRYSVAKLKRASKEVSWLLLGLWLSGLSLIITDIGLTSIAETISGKLVLKLLVVSVLTLNGMVLHRIAFPVLSRRKCIPTSQAVLLAITGAISTSHWLTAAYVGVARPLREFQLEQLLPIYLLFLVVIILSGVMMTTGLQSRLNVINLRRALTRLKKRNWRRTPRSERVKHALGNDSLG